MASTTPTVLPKVEAPQYPKKKEVLERGVPEHLAGHFAQQEYRLSFGLSRWYELLKEHTFKSCFLRLSAEVIVSIVCRVHRYFLSHCMPAAAFAKKIN